MASLSAVLAFGTLGFVAVFAFLNARATDRLKNDPKHELSTLCANSNHWAANQR